MTQSPTDETIGKGRRCVAVVIAARDAEATIARAIHSALAETETAEVVLVDDGSRDGTARRAAACEDGSGRLQVVRQENAGPSSARNAGLALTSAPIWCVLDADDAFVPGRFGRLFEAAGADWDLAADAVQFVAPGGATQVLAAGREILDLSFESFVRGNIPRRKAQRQELGFLQPLMRRRFFEAQDLRFDPTLRFAEDYVLYAQALAKGARFRCVPTPGYLAYVTDGSLSQVHSPEDFARIIAADRAMSILPGLGAGDRQALKAHARLQRLKGQYLLVEAALASGRWPEALGHALCDHHTAAFMFTHRVWGPATRRAKAVLRPAKSCEIGAA
jgi:succinoglycan biosynthesis protein ExoU